MKPGESKRTAFKRLATNRTNTIVDTLKLLGNLSNTNNYIYTDEDVKKILGVIEEELKYTKARFMLALGKNKRIKL